MLNDRCECMRKWKKEERRERSFKGSSMKEIKKKQKANRKTETETTSKEEK